MPRESAADGTKPLEIRPGVGGMPNFRGMYRKGDPTRIPPNQFHSLLNTRNADSEMQSRPGLATVAGTQEDACITGMIEVDPGGTPDSLPEGSAIHLDSRFVPAGTADYPGFCSAAVNEESDPTAVMYWPSDESSSQTLPSKRKCRLRGNSGIVWFRGKRLALCNSLSEPSGGGTFFGAIYEMTYSSDDGLPRVDLSHYLDPDEGTNGEVTSMCVRRERVDDVQSGSELDDDVLYMATRHGVVLRWDGATLSVAHTLPASTGSSVICTFQSHGLFVASPGTGGGSYQTTPGGAWTDVAWPSIAPTPGIVYPSGACDWLGRVVITAQSSDGMGAGAERGYVFYWSPSVPASISVWLDGSATLVNAWCPMSAGGDLYALVNWRGGSYNSIMRATSWAGGLSDWWHPGPVWEVPGVSPSYLMDPLMIGYDSRILLWGPLGSNDGGVFLWALWRITPGDAPIYEEVASWLDSVTEWVDQVTDLWVTS
jgi:hypothetical protein